MEPCIFFAHAPGATSNRWKQFCVAYPASYIFLVKDTELHKIWKHTYVDRFLLWRTSFNAEQAQIILNTAHIYAYCPHDNAFPKQFSQLSDPPIALFYRGAKIDLSKTLLAIIGSRTMSTYGKRATSESLQALAGTNCTIISGLALGIDGQAHYEALKQHLSTIAILPGGIDDTSIVPRQHAHLAAQIISHGGTILSEHPPHARVTAGSFPQRNRLIAALCESLIIIEAAKKSGTLITAEQALDLGKNVFAFPHNIFNLTGEGVNALLEQGAIPIISIAQLQVQLGFSTTTMPRISIDASDIPLLQALHDWITIDELSRTFHLSASSLLSKLMLLELAGHIEKKGLLYRTKSYILAQLSA